MDPQLTSSSVTAVILNYNGAHDTIACLTALYTMPDVPGRVIVVDNGSTDTSVERIREAWKELAPFVVIDAGADGVSPGASSSSAILSSALLLLSENGGYAAGNNAGIREALQDNSCRAVWILNNDTEPEPGALQELCARLNAYPKAGMAGSTLVYAADREIIQCAGGYVFNGYTGATPALCGNERFAAVRAPGFASYFTPVEAKLDYISGASVLVRREVFERIGCLAEEYFLYYEDAEFGLRAKKAGYALAWAPGSVVFHKEGGSTGAKSPGAKSPGAKRSTARSEFIDYLALRNRIYLVRKYYPARLPVAICSYAGVAVNRVRRGQVRRVSLVFRALMDGLAGRMGKPGQSDFPVPSGETM